MTLESGTRLGPYEIVSPLGAGGMGEVYRARDTRLGRDVAVKVLPHHLSGNPEVRARFEREAKAVSSLNHPNICTLFDIGSAGDADYIVMELVEGESLAARLQRDPLPVADVLKIGVQIARALSSAHRAGVIHRDVKPGNVMLGRSGTKLMDFGLARGAGVSGLMGGSAAGAPALTHSPTVAAPLTGEGTILGTLQYMAPEQLEGKEADARCDLWALGCVLYEMATGRRAFEGGSQASLISSIMKDEPRPMAELAPMTPTALDRVVRSCLAKDPDERWQSAQDLVTALVWIEAGSPQVLSSSEPAGDVTYRQLTFGHGSITNARFAPDGRTVLYDAAWEGRPRRIYLTRTESPETTELALPSAALLDVSLTGELALSLDRRYLGSWWLGTGMLAQAPLFGGSPREVLSADYDAAWCPDGRAMAVIRRAGLVNVVEFPIGNVVFSSPSWLVGLRVSPDGSHAAFFDNSSGMRGRSLMIIDREGRARVLATVDFWHGGLAWSPDGGQIFFVESREPRGATVNAVNLSGQRRRIVRLMGSYAVLHDVSSSGDFLLSRAATTYSIGFSTPGAPKDRDLSSFDFSLAKDLSNDGKTLLFDEQGVAHGMEIQTSIRSTDGSAPVRLGPGYARDLSPDGRWALNIHEGQLRVLPRGPGAPRVLDVAPVRVQQFATWHPDGTRIVFLGYEQGRPLRLYVASSAGGSPRPVTPEGVGFPGGTIAKPVSSDGRRLFALDLENRIRLFDLESGAEEGGFPLGEDEEPIRWSGDGRSIFVWRRGDVPARVERLQVETGARELWREYVPADRTGVVCSRNVLLTPDGEQAAYTYSNLLSELYLARGLS